MENTSPMFKENIVYKPFAYPFAVDINKRHESAHWVEDEIPMGDDVSDWKNGKLSLNEKDFITNVLKLFTTTDVLVGQYYLDYLIPVVKNNEIRCMLTSFAAREGVHQRAYALLNDTLGLPESEYHAFLDITALREKSEYAMESEIGSVSDLALSLAKGVFNEGVSLFSSFVMLLNFQRFGKMKATGKITEWSIRDETMHVEGNSWLFRQVCLENNSIVNDEFKKKIYDMARTIVSFEDAFIDFVYQDYTIEGLEKDEVKRYIRYIADRRLVQLGLKENWMIDENPLPWLDWILNATNHTNFFENKVSEYDVGGLQGNENWNSENIKFKIVSRDGCPYCIKAKELIISEGFDAEIIEMNDKTERNVFYDSLGLVGKDRTVPQIWKIDENGIENYIGGYLELEKEF